MVIYDKTMARVTKQSKDPIKVSPRETTELFTYMAI